MAARSCPKAAALTISKRSRTRGDRSRRRSTLSTSARCSVVISSMLVSFTDCYPPPLPQGYDSLHKLTNTYLDALRRVQAGARVGLQPVDHRRGRPRDLREQALQGVGR